MFFLEDSGWFNMLNQWAESSTGNQWLCDDADPLWMIMNISDCYSVMRPVFVGALQFGRLNDQITPGLKIY